MITKARKNAEKLGFHNVEFRQGDVENMPVSANVADVIVSNCVLNLVPNKKNVFNDMFRVLKSGGHFSISDVVNVGQLPEKIRNAAVMYSGCIGGTVPKSEYLKLIKDAGFDTISVQKEKPIVIPDDILSTYLSVEEIEAFNNSDNGIYSITVFGRKPDCCIPDSGCC